MKMSVGRQKREVEEPEADWAQSMIMSPKENSPQPRGRGRPGRAFADVRGGNSR